MKCFIFPILIALAASPVYAQLQAPARILRPVADESMVVMDRGAKLEVLPTQRAVPQSDSSGRVLAHRMIQARASDGIGPHQLGVVFNHAEQQEGYITGEIVFKMKADYAFTGNPSLYPGVKRITTPNVYVVNARTATEFVKVLRRLQARSDVAWVEPTVTHSSAQTRDGAQ